MEGFASDGTFLFEGFRFDRAESCLRRKNGSGVTEPLMLGSRATSLLGLLVERQGELVTKDEIFAAVWPGTAVEEANLTVQISALRRILDRDRARGSCIQTISGRGYRFVVPVTRPAPSAPLDSGGPTGNGAASPVAEDGRTVKFRGIEPVLQQVPPVMRPDRKRLRQVMISFLAGVLCLVAAVAAASYWHSLSFEEPHPHPGPRLSLVVLPFSNLDHDPQTALIADSFTEVLTDDLARSSDGLVIIPSPNFANNTTIDPRQIGRELGVRYIVRGSLQRMSHQARILVQLIDGENGGLLWTDQFETENHQLMEPDGDIAGRLAATLQHALIETVAQRIDREKEGHRDARDFVTLGIAARFHSDSRENRRKAQILYEKALAIDPQSAAARIGIASVLLDNVAAGWTSPAEPDEARAEHLLREALERTPTSSRAHLFMGLLRRLQNRLAESKVELETALARSRNYASAYRQLGITMMFMGQPESGVPHIERGIRLNPYDQNVRVGLWALGSCHLLLGHIEEAVELLHKARTIAPGYPNADLWLAGALGLHGDLGEAREALAEAMKANPDFASLARLRANRPYYTNPHFSELAETTVNAGLRAAGMRDD